jgi:hypothetical protein
MAYALTTMAADESLYEMLHELAFELEGRHGLILHLTVANETTPEKPGGQIGVNLPRTLPFNVVRGSLRTEDAKGRVARPSMRVLPLKTYLLLAEFGERLYLTGMVTSGYETSPNVGEEGRGRLGQHPVRSFRQLAVVLRGEGLDVNVSTLSRAFKIVRTLIEDSPDEYTAIQTAVDQRAALADYIFGKIYGFPHWRSRRSAVAVVQHRIMGLNAGQDDPVAPDGSTKRKRGQRGKDKQPRRRPAVQVTGTSRPAEAPASPVAPAGDGARKNPFDTSKATQVEAASRVGKPPSS